MVTTESMSFAATASAVVASSSPVIVIVPLLLLTVPDFMPLNSGVHDQSIMTRATTITAPMAPPPIDLSMLRSPECCFPSFLCFSCFVPFGLVFA